MMAEPINDLLAQVIRVGFVVARDEQKMRVRVELPDTVSGPLTTDFLQVLTTRAKKDCSYDLPDTGDQVLCVFLPYGKETGFVLGSMYGAEAPPVASGEKWHRTFADGTVLEYNRAKHELLADVNGRATVNTTGDITASAGTFIKAEAGSTAELAAGESITLTAPLIYLNGNLISISAGDAKFVSGGTLSINAAQVSLNEEC